MAQARQIFGRAAALARPEDVQGQNALYDLRGKSGFAGENRDESTNQSNDF
jgi:hypothetical protein